MEITVKNIEDLPAAARELIPHLPASGVVAMYGGMGAGKTTLVAALLHEMGSTDEVSSPTFALVNDYLVEGENGGDRHIYHFDFYRINTLQEAFDLGYEEYFYGDGLCLVEWPEKIEELLPEETLRLHIDTLPDGSRKISLEEE
jgi:tRNA threonylcarbamoyladenosine biosynthesis protein TsaE